MQRGAVQNIEDGHAVLGSDERVQITDTDSPINPRQLLRKNQALIGFYRGAGALDNLFVEERAELYRDLEAKLAKGEVTAPIGKTFTLDQAADAHRALEGRASAGKVILLPNG
mgnify:CR=1 FL=1